MAEKRKARIKKYFLPLVLTLYILGYSIRRIWFHPDFKYVGTIEATQVEVPARVASVISKVDFQEGQTVTKGQTLVELSCEDIEIASHLAEKNFIRALNLFRAGALSREQYDQFSNQQQEAKTRMSWCQIASPIQGVVESKYRELGEWVNPGTKLLLLVDLSDVWAFIYVPQPLIYQLKPGMELMGTLPETKDRQFNGVSRKINPEAAFTPTNVQTQAARTLLVH